MNTENTSWQKESAADYPPPDKKPERRLSLKAAMALATGAPGHETLMPLVLRNDKNLADNEDARRKVETYLLNLQADIINREELLEQKERQFAARENDLKRRALAIEKKERELELREAQAESTPPLKKSEPTTPPQVSDTAQKSENDLFEETRMMLREREAYIEECENALVERLTELTKRETEIEMREEEVKFKANQAGS